MPKCPVSSGPLRKEFCNFGFIVALRRARAPPPHPRLACCEFQQTWMPGTSPGMTTLNALAPSSIPRNDNSGVLLGHSRRANEGADHLGILDAGCALHARGNIDAAGAGDANRLRDIAGMQAPRDHEREPEVEIRQHMPVEYRAKTAGTGGVLRRMGIEQDRIRNGAVAGQ